MSKKLHPILNDQMHWRNCLLMSDWLHSISNNQMHWRFCLFCCLLLNYRTDKLLTQSKYRFVAFDRFISLIWLLENLIERNVDSYKTFKWIRWMCFSSEKVNHLVISFSFNRTITVELLSCSLHLHFAEIR